MTKCLNMTECHGETVNIVGIAQNVNKIFERKIFNIFFSFNFHICFDAKKPVTLRGFF